MRNLLGTAHPASLAQCLLAAHLHIGQSTAKGHPLATAAHIP